MRKQLTLSLAAVALLAGGVAYAAPSDTPDQRSPMAGRDITRAQVEQMAEKAFARMDANGDGKLDQADREARQKARFDRVDTDGDGAITFAEFTAQREHRAERRDQRADRAPDERRMKPRFARRGPGGPGMMMMGKRADSDGDGAVSKAEFQSAMLARFDRADANGDGTLTGDERRAARPGKFKPRDPAIAS